MDLLGIEAQLTLSERTRLEQVRSLLQDQIRQQSIEYWNKEAFPADLLRLLADSGLGRMQLDGYSPLLSGLLHAEIARADISLSAVVGIHNELIVGMIDALGTAEQRKTWLSRLGSFQALGAFALTEPEHGSDIAGGLTTTVRRDGDEYVVNGMKRWIGMGTIADFALVWARDERTGEIGAYLVESHRPGYRASKIENKIGLRIMPNADIEFDQVRIPVTNKLPGATGFNAANDLLMRSRAWVGWQAVGALMATSDITRAYAQSREQFGKPLASFQLIQQSLAEIAGHQAACTAMMKQIAAKQERGDLTMADAALVKSTATRLARDSAAQGRALLGGNGVISDGEMAKVFCDLEILYTYEGTYEINSLIVGRALTGIGAFV